ncbi:unnamed protein product [Notodromas monacha]|uniref:Uncharacterized protein n=1 Tax=Notodromas monacha TaxID=399045 RepID=A0A7R9BF01_9CRUS|nr:unnamed protein product [Notodromas monacha]CAG0914101.1 unnamed protein product [Notodromas monacha]
MADRNAENLPTIDVANESRDDSEDSRGAEQEEGIYYPNCDATIWLRTCENEVVEPIEGKVKGIIPVWLNGTLVRNGPGRIKVGDDVFNHLFDSSALLHRFHINEGQVTYQNKYVRTTSFKRNMAAQRIVVNEFGTRAQPDPCKTLFSRFLSYFSKDDIFTDNANITVFPWDGPDEVYALTETPFMQKIDIQTLETLDRVDITKYVSVMGQSAHPHLLEDGTIYTLGQGIGLAGCKYCIVEFPPKSKDNNISRPGSANSVAPGQNSRPEAEHQDRVTRAKIVATHQARWRLSPSYMHSFCITKHYFIIIEQPLVVSMAKAAKVHVTQRALVETMQWYNEPTYIHLISRETGKGTKVRYEADPLFFLHTINAFEEGDFVILDLCAYPDAKMLDCMYIDALRRFVLPTRLTMGTSSAQQSRRPLACNPAMMNNITQQQQQPQQQANSGGGDQHKNNLVTLHGSRAEAYLVRRDAVRVVSEPLCDLGCEVPRINYERCNGKPYTYFYAIASDVDLERPGTLIKVNATTKTRQIWSEDNVYPSEPIFITAPHPRSEDDGVVLSVLLRAKGLDKQVTLLILDARSFKELGRVDFEADGPVPKDLHGWYFPTKKYA